MNVTAEVFATRVRVRAGNPTANDVPEAMVTEAVAAALREYSKYRGPEALEPMLTVAEQQDYQLAARFAQVEDVVWGEDVDVRGDIFRHEGFEPFESLAGLDTFRSPSLLNMVYQQLEDFRKQFEGTWQVYDAPTGGALWLRLVPPPANVQRMLVMGRELATLASVAEKDAELLMDGCLWKLNEMREASMAGVDSASFGGGSLSFGTRNFTEAAKRFEERFTQKIGAFAPQFRKG